MKRFRFIFFAALSVCAAACSSFAQINLIAPWWPVGDPYAQYHLPTTNGWRGIVGPYNCAPGTYPAGQTEFCDPTVAIPGSPMTMPVDGVSDCYPAITNAFSLCPSNEYVQLPNGIFYFSHSFTIGRYQSLRGVGSGMVPLAPQTLMLYSNQVNSSPSPAFIALFDTSADGVYGETSTTNELLYGSNIVSIPKTFWTTDIGNGLSIYPLTNDGKSAFLIDICETNDPNLVSLTGYAGEGGLNQSNGYSLTAMSQVLVITNIATNGNAVNLYSRYPFFWPYHATNNPALVAIHRIGAVQSGVSGVHVIYLNTNSASSTGCFNCSFGLDCWFDDIQIEAFPRDGFYLNNCAECLISHCFLNHAIYTDSADGYGYHLFGPNSDNLVYNNIAYGCRHSLILEGGSGNAFAYNACFGDNNETESPGYVTQDVSCHASHPAMNVFEGNIFHKWDADHVHGSSSHNGAYRNLVTAGMTNNQPFWYPGDTNVTSPFVGAVKYSSSRGCIAIEPWNAYEWSAGNILGMPGISKFSSPHYALPSPIGSGDGWIYAFAITLTGSSPGNTQVTNTADLIVSNTFIINGNYNYDTGTTTWLSNTSFTLPASVVFSNRPADLSNSVPWPVFGPDVIASPIDATLIGVSTSVNSAWLRFEAYTNNFTIGSVPPWPFFLMRN